MAKDKQLSFAGHSSSCGATNDKQLFFQGVAVL